MECCSSLRNCAFCPKVNAAYTCPRCNLLYCSKVCYQSAQHLDCSEQFYKECVEEELKLEGVNDDSKKQMMKILTRFQENAENDDQLFEKDSDDEDSLPDLYERLENVDLNDADEVWRRLSEQEKLEFQAILNSGDVSQLIPDYEPWWGKRYDKAVEELDDFLNNKNKEEYTKICPHIKEIAPFDSISKVKPSPCILWNICNILGSYAFTVRRYLGEHHDYCSEALNTITSVSTNINSNENFDSMPSAIDNVIFHVTSNADYACSKEEANFIYEDVDRLLAGPESSQPTFYILSALSDLYSLFDETLWQEKNQKKKDAGEFSKKFPSLPMKPVDKGKSRLCMKKLDFFLSWVKDHYQG